MEECLGVNGRQKFVRLDCNLEVKTCVGAMLLLYNTLYGRPYNFHNGLIKLSCILNRVCLCVGREGLGCRGGGRRRKGGNATK